MPNYSAYIPRRSSYRIHIDPNGPHTVSKQEWVECIDGNCRPYMGSPKKYKQGGIVKSYTPSLDDIAAASEKEWKEYKYRKMTDRELIAALQEADPAGEEDKLDQILREIEKRNNIEHRSIIRRILDWIKRILR